LSRIEITQYKCTSEDGFRFVECISCFLRKLKLSLPVGHGAMFAARDFDAI
jgi:hypothetical protein